MTCLSNSHIHRTKDKFDVCLGCTHLNTTMVRFFLFQSSRGSEIDTHILFDKNKENSNFSMFICSVSSTPPLSIFTTLLGTLTVTVLDIWPGSTYCVIKTYTCMFSAAKQSIRCIYGFMENRSFPSMLLTSLDHKM